MLDGLLGRGGFSSKCKSLIKLTRTRIDAVRRKRNATQKFLKKDIADLLANGLESNALGRADGLIAELCLSSCYDFIDHVCELILKHLSTMQKNSDCPEDCREAVASLMFSAARFSDLPELRDLRDIFRDRFGDSLECYVNQNLKEHIAPKSPNMDRKLKLLEDIASEFSIAWNRAAFEQRSKAAEERQKIQAYLHPVENKYIAPHIPKPVQKIGDNNNTVTKKKIEVPDQRKGRDALDNGQGLDYNRHNSQVPPRAVPKSKDANSVTKKKESHDGHGSLAQENGNPVRTNAAIPSSMGRVEDQSKLNREVKVVPKIEHKVAAYQVKAEPSVAKGERNVESIGHVVSPSRKLPEEEADKVKPKLRSNIPPPYVKPKKSKHRSRHSESNIDDTLTFGGAQNIAPVKDDEIPHYTVEYYKSDASGNDPTARRRSRRRHHKLASAPSDSDANEEVRVIRRTSTSRRRNGSKKGLQILCDDDGRRTKDEEERMMDKLLLHYSKKPVGSGGPNEKAKRRTSPKEDDMKDENQQPSRSFSLPREQSSSEMKKVFTRAATFTDETSTPAKHVHPNLPDYDDLAARFAALRRK